MLLFIKNVCGHVKPLVLLRPFDYLGARRITIINVVQGWTINLTHRPLWKGHV